MKGAFTGLKAFLRRRKSSDLKDLVKKGMQHVCVYQWSVRQSFCRGEAVGLILMSYMSDDVFNLIYIYIYTKEYIQNTFGI